MLPYSAVLVMRVGHGLRISIEQTFTALQPLRGLGRKSAKVKVEFPYFFEPTLQLFQLDVVFLHTQYHQTKLPHHTN